MPSQSWLLETRAKLPATSQPSRGELCPSKLLFGAGMLLALLSYALPALKTIKPQLFSICNNQTELHHMYSLTWQEVEV